MIFLRIVDNEQLIGKYSDCWISKNHKYLHLSYFSDQYDDFFDELDREINTYDVLETLVLQTDFINEIPRNVIKFKNLKKINVQGSRFWNLRLTQVPECVETLILTEQTNLQEECINGMDRLVNLTEIMLDMNPFRFSNIFENGSAQLTGVYGYDDEGDDIKRGPMIPCLSGLKKISFHTGISYRKEDLVRGWKKIFKNNYLFSKIKEKIVSIDLNDESGFPIISITLSRWDHS
jgi:Leucine-rich repeat (LRR) protein